MARRRQTLAGGAIFLNSVVGKSAFGAGVGKAEPAKKGTDRMRNFIVTSGIAALAAGLIFGNAACGSDETGDDGAAGSGNTTATNSGGSGATGNTGGTSDGGGTGATGGSGDGGNSSGSGSYCALSCTEAADCCFGNPMCPGDAYPNNPTCDDGVCGGAQCATNDECTFGGALPGYECLVIDAGGTDYHACGLPCTTDDECAATQLKCVGEAKDGGKFCSTDAAPGCASDADCGKGFGDTCDTATGACTCSRSGECSAMGVDTCVQ
jgi:hypothetical protein